ncbi:TonB-dependent receptor [Pseudomaricurvus alkylphenolicus]|uniref:TonB-dependent receptor plug domain-containing protein n=1 Tax=Pseudomaricurvus alkylphenolicus TaxID=1306991 RepID=UPI0014236D5B|nr:TonB-dependent receptor [Pseudomaricurvus alkylphenolicus]NIB40163.1 TonB-dependent receptor [Pseudomaricurvus alkylphenolicus]
MPLIRTSSIALAVSIAAASKVVAEDDLYALSLRELMASVVITPSKAEQSAADSPGIVTTYNAREIELFGGRDLGEVLSRILGFEEYNNLSIGRNMVTIRSDFPIINNNHVLFLLNGVPLNRESYTGGIWNQTMLQSIPLGSIRQLEVVRGPGSVLYGTNAFAGVVNILTKPQSEMSNSVSVRAGRYGTRGVNLNWSEAHQGWQWTTSLRWMETDGWPLEMTDTDGESFSEDVFAESPALIANLKKNGFSANLYWGITEQFTLRGRDGEAIAGNTENEKYALMLGYEWDFNDRWRMTTNLSHVGGRTDHKVASSDPAQLQTILYETDDSRIELTARGRLSENSGLLLGGTVDYFTGSTPSPSRIVPDWNDYLLAVYGQYEIKLGSTQLTLGAQYNHAETGYESLVPRLGLVHHFNTQSGIKLLYGQAFRAPYVTELKIDIAIPTLDLSGNEDLEPEIVTTWDLQYFYNGQVFSGSATLFRNEQEDLIFRDPVGPRELVFANKGELVIEGLELEGKYQKGNWYVTGSFGAQRNSDGDNLDETTLQPDNIFKSGLGYATAEWSLGVFNSHFAAHHSNEKVKPSRVAVNPEPESHNRLSVNWRYHPASFAGWSLEAYVDNLLDEEIFLPVHSTDSSGLNTKPVLAGRFFMVTLEKSF